MTFFGVKQYSFAPYISITGNSILKKLFVFIIIFFLIAGNIPVAVFADEVSEEEAPEQTAPAPAEFYFSPGCGWPEAPDIAPEGAVLMDADSGAVLYGKNMNKTYYPASITKIMTCLLAMENSSLDEMVEFSSNAVFGIDRGSSNVGMDVGQSITMEEAIYCIMLASANEVAAAVAEHISGSVDSFAELMNERAKELGCKNTHFVNANGLPNEEHYTTPYDMALIARAFNNNGTLRRIAGTANYEIKATATQPDTFLMPNHHKMYPNKDYAYEPVTWGKTGYTVAAGNTLVTCARNNGLDLICVVMKSENPDHYTDTRKLFEYGFSNFKKVNVAEFEKSYDMGCADFFATGSSIFGNTDNVISIDSSGKMILPIDLPFESLTSKIIYVDDVPGRIATVNYSYDGNYVGNARINVADSRVTTFMFGAPVSDNKAGKEKDIFNMKDNVTYVNVKKILFAAGIAVGSVIIIFAAAAFLKNYNFSGRRRRDIKKRNSRYHSEFDKFRF